MGRSFEKNGRRKTGKESRCPESGENVQGGEEVRNCDGIIALRETWKEWEKNGEQEQNVERI